MNIRYARVAAALLRATIIILITCLLQFEAIAQQDTTPRRGFHPGGSYAISDIETIGTSNGNLILNLPVVSLPKGRGTHPGATLKLVYNSKLLDARQEVHYDPLDPAANYTFNVLQASDKGGWRYGLRYQIEFIDRDDSFVNQQPQCPDDRAKYKYKISMTFPDGNSREFRPTGYSDLLNDGYYWINYDGWISNCGAGGGYYAVTSGMTYYSTDGSYLRLFIAHDGDGVPWNNAWTLYYPDGSRVTDGNAPQRIYDSNNNYIEIQNITLPNGNPANKVIDQLGRFFTIEYGQGAGLWYDYISVTGANSQTLQWTVKWKTNWVYKDYIATLDLVPDPPGTHKQLFTSIAVIDEITMPAQTGSLKYNFLYNGSSTQPSGSNYTYGWGEISQMTLPSGARTDYQYLSSGANGIFWSDALDNHATRKDLTYELEYDCGQSCSPNPVTETWLYSMVPNQSGQITSPDGGVSRDYFDGTAPPNWSSGLAVKSERPDGSIVERIWQQNRPFSSQAPNPYVKTEFTSIRDISGSLVKTAIRDFKYDKNGNTTQVSEYDWVAYGSVPRDGNGRPTGLPGGLTPKRVTVNTFYNPTPDAADTTTDDPDVYHKSTSPQLRNTTESSEVRSDIALNTVLSRAEFFYDNFSTTGNLITQKSWDSTKGAVSRPLSAGNSISTTHHYVSYGNRDWTKDPKNNQTVFTYDANGLFVIRTETAYGTAVQRRTDRTYDFNTGLVTSETDFDNSVTNQTTYDDLGRPTIVKQAVGSSSERWTRTEYYDQARRVVVRSAQSAADDKKLVTVQHYDQLGRIRLSRQLENSGHSISDETLGIKIQTRYFAGNTFFPNGFQVVSNPYRAANSSAAGSEETMGWTRSKFDKGGRVIEVQSYGAGLPEPWGVNSTGAGAVTTEYDGEFTKVTDQAGKVRRSMIDGLGRLARVDEPDSGGNLGGKTSPVQPTSYTYSALGNLTQVSQGVQTRTFTYSSLSRLTSAVNPESGTITYQYDNNGNLTGRTDPRPATTTITYDALDRPVTKTYTGVSTPAVNYYYDNQTLPSGAPSYSRGASRGRTVAVTYGGGSTGSYFGYDSLGRVTIKYQRIDTTNYQIQATYNKAGAMTAETYPSARTVGYSYNDAGRLTVFTGNLGDGLQRTYANISQYNPAGQRERESYGTTAPLYLKLHYNRRMQLVDLRLGSINDAWNWNRGALIFYYGTNGVTYWNPFSDDADNNGNVRRQVNYVPTAVDGSGTVTSYVIPELQDYTYDSLNRIGSVSEQQQSAAGAWAPSVSQTFAYDRYGNKRIPSQTGGINGYNPTYNTANNRIIGLTYDTAGNIIQDALTGGTMTYDAENRLLTATNGGGGSYTYDGEGRRVKRVTAGQTWWYVYGINGELLAEYQSGAPTIVRKEYGYRGGQLLVVWDNDKAGNERLKWLVTDHLGSTRMEADLSGSLAGMRRHDYLPFGEELTSAHGAQRSGVGYELPASNVRQKFTGKERDGETGLDYFLARYYSSIQGRFTSPDEFSGGPEELYDFTDTASDNPTFYADLHDPQSLNKYQYCYNDPLRYVDPDGHSGTLVGALIGAAVGATRAVVEGKTSAKEIGAAAAGGAVAGAMMGSVVDTGGATLVIAGGLAGAAGGMVERMILGEKTNLQDMIADSAGGAIGSLVGVKATPRWAADISAKGKALKWDERINPDRLNHLFGQEKHNLGALLAKFDGSQEKAFRALEQAAQKALKEGRLNLKNGVNTRSRITVQGVQVDLIGGKVINGKFKISSASRRDVR
ncbi:MAG: RHS repeat-associated core domain-containing protein [Blastocatellales bacterium]